MTLRSRLDRLERRFSQAVRNDPYSDMTDEELSACLRPLLLADSRFAGRDVDRILSARTLEECDPEYLAWLREEASA